jgi:hypothetical protein
VFLTIAIFLYKGKDEDWDAFVHNYKYIGTFKGKIFYNLLYGSKMYNYGYFVGANKDGLYLTPYLYGTNFLIPWRDVSITKTTDLWTKYLVVQASKSPNISIHICAELENKIISEVGKLWPSEKESPS